MKIKFLPFINDDTGKNWRTKREKAFLTNQGLHKTNEINEIRNNHGNTTLYPTDNDYYTEIMKLLEGRKQILTSLHEDKIERRSLSLFHDGRLITVDYGDTESNIDKTVRYMDQVYKEDYGSERYQNTLFH